MLKYWLALVLLWLGVGAQAQGYFNRRYTNSNSGFQSGITNIVPLDTGGYLGFGQADNYPFANSKAIQLRWLDGQGQQVRQRYYGQPGRVYYSGFNAALLQVPGGYALAGSVTLPGGENQATLWRFLPQGDSLWCRLYRNPDSTNWIFDSGCRMADGGYALVGSTQVGISPNISGDLLVLRTDSLG